MNNNNNNTIVIIGVIIIIIIITIMAGILPRDMGSKVRLQVSTGLCFPFLQSATFSSRLLHLESICALNSQMNELLMHFSYFNG